jgi:hypothetical protein
VKSSKTLLLWREDSFDKSCIENMVCVIYVNKTNNENKCKKVWINSHNIRLSLMDWFDCKKG